MFGCVRGLLIINSADTMNTKSLVLCLNIVERQENEAFVCKSVDVNLERIHFNDRNLLPTIQIKNEVFEFLDYLNEFTGKILQ